MPIGAMSALITPFKNGKIDTQSYEYLIKRQIQYGMDACVPAGTTGESATMSHNEHKECIEIAVQTCKNTKVKVLAGAGSNNTIEAIELAQFAQKCGADAILSVVPYYNKPTQEGLYRHYKAIAESIEIPVMLYNVPSRTGVGLEVATILKLFHEVKNIYAIKEASGSLERVYAMIRGDSNLKILSGDDMLNFNILSLGGQGVISVTGNLFPQEIADLCHFAMKQNFTESLALSNKLYDINEALFYQSNPIPIKAAMYLQGLIPTLEYRLPLCEPSKECMEMLEKTLEKYEVKK
ncbi:4-hydroxy-tetrahydrodipicolinate synthase [Helicobacter didelphidarum]|uniref:4-hydroxy-tetrahydrodipicolinate synthase n=1 Tax=Helicobacter didelphidarum TaxID=2040648 RepID=A0A3D8IQ28_9HELI|nr:4-hydroxy-tetrahydrodipicolinate synthase [Helicobacter didelphidarum]RDU66744.1 4-hydroxy-tetrahydrodipicolinate synthase [Helicobacter didelphidarum]